MADERSNAMTYKRNPDFIKYDRAYYNALKEYIKGDVLDVGCGAGMFIRDYINKDEVEMVVGIDKYIDEMPTHEKLTSIQAKFPFELEGKYDTVVCTEFVEHIERKELEPLLEQVKKVLNKKGLFIGSTPNKISPTTNPYHLYEYTISELTSILRNYFNDVETWDNGQNCTIWVAKNS